MPKIQAKAGASLADQYDVLGSIAGVDELLSKDVSLVHEMGEVLLSERMGTSILQMSTAALVADTNFEITTTTLPDTPTRIMAIECLSLAGDINEIARAAVTLQDPSSGREFVIWSFDETNDTEQSVFWSDNGAARSAVNFMLPSINFAPLLLMRMGVLDDMPTLNFTGRSAAVVGTTVVARVMLYFASPSGGPAGATVGLPIPSW